MNGNKKISTNEQVKKGWIFEKAQPNNTPNAFKFKEERKNDNYGVKPLKCFIL